MLNPLILYLLILSFEHWGVNLLFWIASVQILLWTILFVLQLLQLIWQQNVDIDPSWKSWIIMLAFIIIWVLVVIVRNIGHETGTWPPATSRRRGELLRTFAEMLDGLAVLLGGALSGLWHSVAGGHGQKFERLENV